MEDQGPLTDKPGRIVERLLAGDVKSNTSPPKGGSIAVRRRTSGFPSIEDWDTLTATRSSDGDVPHGSAGGDHPVDRKVAEPDLPALHPDPGAATDAGSGDGNDSKPRLPHCTCHHRARITWGREKERAQEKAAEVGGLLSLLGPDSNITRTVLLANRPVPASQRRSPGRTDRTRSGRLRDNVYYQFPTSGTHIRGVSLHQ